MKKISLFIVLTLLGVMHLLAQQGNTIAYTFDKPIKCLKTINTEPSGDNKSVRLKDKKQAATLQINKIKVGIKKPEPFISFSLFAEGQGLSNQNVKVFYSISKGSKAEWIPVSTEHEEVFENKFVSGLMQLDKTVKKINLKIVMDAGNITLEKIQLRFYSAGNASIDESSFFLNGQNGANSRMSCPCPQPSAIARSSWGSGYGLNTNIYSGTASYTTVTHLAVHHAAGVNTSTNWAAVVAGIFDLHINPPRNYSDIGYNWLIDPNGVLYVGRGGGNNVVGAHFCGFNGGTMGVCFLGDFHNTGYNPTTAALNKLTELLAWKSCDSGINPTGSSYHSSSNLTLNHICGHRDGCSTDCPGDDLYSELSSIRTDVANLIASTNCSGGGGNCTGISLSPSSETHGTCAFSTTSGADDIIMDAQPNCDYTITESCSWLTIDGATSGTMNSNGQAFLNYSITDNSSTSSRTCTININGSQLSITQNGCDPDFDRSTINNVSASGATITNTEVDGDCACAWTIQIGCNWVTVNQSSGTGDYDDLEITVQANSTSGSRSCTLSIGGNTLVINQNAPTACTYTISPPNALNISASGASGSFTVTPSQSNCSWMLDVTPATCLTSITDLSGTGTETLNYTVGANTSCVMQACTLTIQGTNTSFLITQLAGNTPPSIQISPSNPTICAGQSVTLTATGANSYSWSNGGNNSSTSVQTSGTYSVTGTTGSCTAIASTTVTQASPPNISVSASPQSISVGQSTTLTALGGTQYVWSTGQTAASFSDSPSTSTTYSVTVTDASGCTATGQVTVSVGCTPIDTSVTITNGCDLTAKNISGATYQWYRSGTLINGGTSRFYTATETGTFYVIITVGSCIYQSGDHFLACESTGITNVNETISLTVIPNPNSGLFEVQLRTKTSEKIRISVINTLGQLVYQTAPEEVTGFFSRNIELGNVATGVYFVKLDIGNTFTTQKVLIK